MTFGDNKLEQTGFLAAYALANTGVITTVFKVITGRQRPYKDNGKDTWHWLSDYFHSPNTIGDDNHSSFPSGHSAVAWSLASVISTEYNDTKFVAPVAYTLATAVSLSDQLKMTIGFLMLLLVLLLDMALAYTLLIIIDIQSGLFSLFILKTTLCLHAFTDFSQYLLSCLLCLF